MTDQATARPLRAGGEHLAAPILVLKVGGESVTRGADRASLAQHVRGLVADGVHPVIVHGGGGALAALQAQLGRPTGDGRTLTALRGPQGIEVAAMALRGYVNTWLVTALAAARVRALGLSGLDLCLMRSRLLNAEKLGAVGGPPRVDARALSALLAQGIVPVLAPLCLGPEDQPLWVNPDTVAHTVAAALGAATLDFVSDVPAVETEAGRRVRRLAPGEASALLRRGEVPEAMIPKLQAALAALGSGIGRVRIGTLESIARDQATCVEA